MVFSVLIAVIVAAAFAVILMMSKVVAQKHKSSTLVEKVHKKGRAAESLKIKRQTLQHKLKKYHI